MMESTIILDSFGRKLLDELQANARLSTAELARRIGLSPTATAERMRQLEESGVVQGYSARIDPEALGLSVQAFVRISSSGPNYHRLLDYLRTLEEVRACHHLTGGDDFLLDVAVLDLAHLEALIEALLPYGSPVTSLVLSTPIERHSYPASGKLATLTPKARIARRR
jgi:Lrp/AsnC family leucine-responsive transcriptional regulator